MPRYSEVQINGRGNAVHIPRSGASDAAVIVALKGKGSDGTGLRFLRKHDFQSICNQGAVIIAPDQQALKQIGGGLKPHWDRSTEEDSEHVIRCLQWAASQGADTTRALVMGWSSGGALAWHLWLHYRWAFSAAAVVGACLGRQYAGIHPPAVPMYYQHGTRDTVAPFQGDTRRMGWKQATLWAGLNDSPHLSRSVLNHGHPWHPAGEDTQLRIVNWARAIGAI